jgi:hypothetical protein
MAHNGSQVGAHVYANSGFAGRDIINQFDGVIVGIGNGGFTGTPSLPRDYLDRNGNLSPPPSGYWHTDQLWAYGPHGKLWVFTWTGTITTPQISDVNCYGPGTMREATAGEVAAAGATPAGPNRKYYIIQNTVVSSYTDLRNPDFGATVTGASGNYGFAYLLRLRFVGQSGPISNLRFYPLSEEPALLAGELVSSEWTTVASGMGSLRFLDMCRANFFPSAFSDYGLFAPDNVSMALANPTAYVGVATKLGENYWDVPLRSDKPSATDGMVLWFRIPEAMKYMQMTVYKTGSSTPVGTVPAGKTYILCNLRRQRVLNDNWGPNFAGHGLANGDPISRIREGGYDSDEEWLIPPGPHQLYSHMHCAVAVTVINSDWVSIDWDSSAVSWTTRNASFICTPRIRYGGQTFTMSYAGNYGATETRDGDPNKRLALRAALTPHPWNVCGNLEFMAQLQTPFGRTPGPTWSTFHFVHTGGEGTMPRPHYPPKIYKDLCNKIGAHCYLPISHTASDADVTQLCNYYADNLDPGNKLILELGNEHWNYGADGGKAMPRLMEWQLYFGTITTAGGVTRSTYRTGGISWGEGYGYHARRIYKLAKSIFASKGKADKLMTVHGLQLDAGGVANLDPQVNPGRDYGAQWYADGDRPQDYIDAFAPAVYYSVPWQGVSEVAVNFPGIKEAVWKWKQGGALREESYDFIRTWVEAPRGAAGAAWANPQTIPYFTGASGLLTAGNPLWYSWSTTTSYYNKKLVLYEWNNDWYASASAYSFPDLFGTGAPASNLRPPYDARFGYGNASPPTTYYDRTGKTLYALYDSGWVAEKFNIECTWNGVDLTRKDYLNWLLGYLRSNARAQEVRTFVTQYFACNPGVNLLPHVYVQNNPEQYRQLYTLWPVGSLDGTSSVPPAVQEYRAIAPGELGAALSGRGFLTASAAGTITRTAAAAGRGILSATGTKSAQQVFSGLSDYAENAALDFLLRATGSSPTTVYLALHIGTTSENGTTNEVSTSTGYARQAITFNAPSGGQIVSSAQVAFGPFSSAPGTVVSFSIWTASSGGNCLATGQFTSSATPQVGYSLNVPAGGIQITAN